MRTLLIDIETAPAVATVWGTGKQYIGHENILHPGRILCYAWAWHGETKPVLEAEWETSHRKMIRTAHDLLDAADAIVHYNGERFDAPHLNTEFFKASMTPPASYEQIDLYKTIKSRFRLESNRLAYVARTIGGEQKSKVDYELWLDVTGLSGCSPEQRAAAQKKMGAYCVKDVAVLAEAYDELLPWINRHPNVGLRTAAADLNRPTCPRCGSEKVKRNGSYYTGASRFQQYRCKDCGAHSRGARRESTTMLREVSA